MILHTYIPNQCPYQVPTSYTLWFPRYSPARFYIGQGHYSKAKIKSRSHHDVAHLHPLTNVLPSINFLHLTALYPAACPPIQTPWVKIGLQICSHPIFSNRVWGVHILFLRISIFVILLFVILISSDISQPNINFKQGIFGSHNMDTQTSCFDLRFNVYLLDCYMDLHLQCSFCH